MKPWPIIVRTAEWACEVANQCIILVLIGWVEEKYHVQANMAIGDLPYIPTWQEQHQFAKQHYGEGYFKSENTIEVLGNKHYTVTINLGGILPTKKYSIVLLHPTRNKPTEFVFTVSIYHPAEFEKLIELGDDLVKSFRWLEQGIRMDNIVKKGEPRGFDGRSLESEYSIEHPLIGNQSLILESSRAIDECLRIEPTNLDYLNAKNIIREYKINYHLSL